MPYKCRFLFPRVKRIVAILTIVSLVPFPVFAAQESFPFLAEAINERVNVRAGQSQNFEKLCQLEKGEKSLSWARISAGTKFSFLPGRMFTSAINMCVLRAVWRGRSPAIA